ncbi:MAG: fibronectin type III domain-containing protein [Verrucomicrobiae bacterium]|nr:fibronectin type III domain-containing protein [Verrucomicrobiae bacterium]
MFHKILNERCPAGILSGWAPTLLTGLLTVAVAPVASASPVPLVPQGAQYAPAGNPIGDQLAPRIAFRSNGGCLVWHDNLTDGDGLGVSARRLSGQLAGLSSLRVNQDGVGDQENPQVAILSDGSNLIVWQSGRRDSQRIVGRVLRADGQFAGPEFLISSTGSDNRNPRVAVAGNGTALVVWAAEGVDGSMSAVQARRLDATGLPVGEAFVLNQETRYHQRDPAVATTGDGTLVAVWISEQQRFKPSADVFVSEQQRFQNSVDVFARRIDSEGAPVGDEFLINTSDRPCATPAVIGLPGRGFAVTWAEHHQDTDSGYTWDIIGRIWSDRIAATSSFLVNQRRTGVQIFPQLALSADAILAVYQSAGGDGNGDGVVGRWFGVDGSFLSDEFVVNTKTSGSQMHATVAADGAGRLVVVWATFGGITKGMDLAAQRFSLPKAELAPPGPPFLFSASSSRIQATWPEVQGNGVVGYDVYVNNATEPVRTTEGTFLVTGLAPKTTVSVRVAYVLADGQKSPLSASASATTWGEDDNADGLPDDWQKLYFGADPALWPAPGADTDGDGADNRTEFLAGTDPTSASSVLKVRLVGTPQGVLLEWDTRPGAVYQIQGSTDLRDWTNLDAPRLAADVTDSIPAGNTPANAYYRITLLR